LDPGIEKEMKESGEQKLKDLVAGDEEMLTVLYAIPFYAQNPAVTLKQALRNEVIYNLLLDSPNYSYLARIENEDLLNKVIKKRRKSNAPVIFTNVHQSKGKEYEHVVVGDDFFANAANGTYRYSVDEVRVSHTAVTRARKSLMFYQDGNENRLLSFFLSGKSPAKDSFAHEQVNDIAFNGGVSLSSSQDEVPLREDF